MKGERLKVKKQQVKATFHYSPFAVPYIFVPLHFGKHCHGLSLVSLWHERKVRAAQDAPLVKVQAVGDGWIWQKRTTAFFGR